MLTPYKHTNTLYKHQNLINTNILLTLTPYKHTNILLLKKEQPTSQIRNDLLLKYKTTYHLNIKQPIT